MTRNIASAPDKKRFLVYTSAGDINAIPLWLQGRRNFDLWVTYYGEKQSLDLPGVDHWQKRVAGKFQNLRLDWMKSPEIFGQYDSIMVMDDDIVIDGSDISRLFELREEYAITVMQPAFLRYGKTSHWITRHRFWSKLHYSQFIETTCPLFERNALERFLEHYDGSLAGWGIDHWFMHVLRSEPNFNAAIIDEIQCINPHDRTKPGKRQISSLQPDSEREADWIKLKTLLGIPEIGRVFGSGQVCSTLHEMLVSRPRSIRLRKKQLKWITDDLWR